MLSHDLGCFSFSGTMKFQVVQGHQTAAGYVEMFQQASLLNEGPHLCSDGWIFQKDGAAVQRLPDEGRLPGEQ